MSFPALAIAAAAVTEVHRFTGIRPAFVDSLDIGVIRVDPQTGPVFAQDGDRSLADEELAKAKLALKKGNLWHFKPEVVKSLIAEIEQLRADERAAGDGRPPTDEDVASIRLEAQRLVDRWYANPDEEQAVARELVASVVLRLIADLDSDRADLRASQAEVERLREQNKGLYQAIQHLAKEQESLSAEVERLRDDYKQCEALGVEWSVRAKAAEAELATKAGDQ